MAMDVIDCKMRGAGMQHARFEPAFRVCAALQHRGCSHEQDSVSGGFGMGGGLLGGAAAAVGQPFGEHGR